MTQKFIVILSVCLCGFLRILDLLIPIALLNLKIAFHPVHHLFIE